MPVDEHHHDDQQPPPQPQRAITPISSEIEENAAVAPRPPESTAGGGGGDDEGGGSRSGSFSRYVSRRNAARFIIGGIAALIVLALVVILFYRSGRIDNLIAAQLVRTLAQYGIRAEIGSFRTRLGPRTAELRDLQLYDAETGARLGKIDRLLATVRIEDLFAINLRRNVNLEALDIDGLEMWVVFDEKGRSNLANLRLPEPDPNRRILFSYSTARVTLHGGVIHYGDERYDISGEARNVRAVVQPDDPNAAAESRMNRVELALSESTFVYNGRPVDHIAVEARARLDQTRAIIEELILRSPVAETRLSGTMDDWRALRYRLDITSTVDLTQLSDVLQTGATLRGAGNFVGTVAGEGARYQVRGEIESDALAADGVRLRALNVQASGSGDGADYEAQGRAVAELLSAGDFQLNAVQLVGSVMGTGTDFRWVGELRAAAARSGATTISDLILNDARAELRDGRMSGSASRTSVSRVSAADATVRGIAASGARFTQTENGTTSVVVPAATADTVVAADATVRGVTAAGVAATLNPDDSANVTLDRLTVSGLSAAGARTGSLNIAGVRLMIRDGRVEGSSGDVEVGAVHFRRGATEGRIENVRVARPSFVLEPSGRYRASADLSLGGGVLGTMRLGTARGSVLATSNQIQLNDFTADVFGGRARGDATVSTGGGASRVAADFTDLDVGGLIALLTGRVVPIAGEATGSVNLQFPGTTFEAASGTINTRFSGASGTEAGGRTPLAGELSVRADRGLFQLENASLRSGSTTLNAQGQFSFGGDSNLNVNLDSADAAELQRVLVASGLAPEIESQLERYGIALAGDLDFNGTLTGSLRDPNFSGRASVGSLTVRGRDLGALSASIAATPTEVQISDGQLAERDGGGARFTATIPRFGENNISLEATLNDLNLGNILAAATTKPAAAAADATLGGLNLTGLGPASGQINIAGLPGAMKGRADLRVAAGTIGGHPYEEISARAAFDGAEVNLENLDARLPAGRVSASGTANVGTGVFDARAKGDDVQLELLRALLTGTAATPAGGLPQAAGTIDFTANAAGNLSDPRSFNIDLDARGSNVTINGQPAGELSLVGRTTPDRKFRLDLTTGILGQPQVIAAEVNLSDEELPVTVATTLTGVDLTQLFRTLLPGGDIDVSGRATGTLTASGRLLGEEGLRALRGRAEFSELVVRVRDIPLAAQSPLVVLFSPNEIEFERTRFTGPGTDILFGGTAALGEGGRQNLTINGQLNLRVLNNLSPNIFLSGTARAGVRVAGTYADPRLTGTVEVAGASFSTLITDERLTMSSINGLVRFTADQAQIESLTGVLGGGRVRVSGGASLAGLQPQQFSLNVFADNVTVPFPDDFRTTADANLDVRGSLQSQFIEGSVVLLRAEYTNDIDLADLIERRREDSITESGGGGGAGGGLFGPNTRLDIDVTGRDALVVRNNLADIVGSVTLDVQGTLDDPVIGGRVTVARGTLNFRNDRYEVTRGFIDLPPRRDADPVLNIQAESEIRGYRITVGLTGPLSQPQTTLRSDPALPQADLVALITTGNLSSGDQSASTLAQTGLGTATSLLTDTLINAPVRRATDRLFGLNRFEIDPLITGRGGASPTARLTVGRQINRDLSLTYSTNVTTDQNQVVALEYRVSDRLSFIARYEQGSTRGLTSVNNNFNFEIRFRKRF